jgi:DNA-binding winged helix-turn-helix (wHTH) protein/predicted ATPase
MASVQCWSFGAFRLDASTTCLWRGEQLLPLPPKPLAVLAYLVARAGQVVTKDELLEAVWPETVVSEGVLKTCLAQIRRVLSETAQAPQYIATVHRRGYRFMAPVTMQELPAPTPEAAAEPFRGSQTVLTPPALLVARQAEMVQLHQWWTQALQGTRQVVFVTGEAGIGKTSLVDAFVAQVATSATVWFGRGQCIEQYGAGEAYLPLLEAFGQLGRGRDGARLVELLHQHAPSWLLQMPALLPASAYEVLQQRSSGTTRDRMLRELAEAVETLTMERPLVLVVEDLHWSDLATLDWLAFVARRRTAARFLVLATYRPADAVMRAHPVHTVMQELQRQARCTELVLNYLSEVGVVAYLTHRFDGLEFPEGLAWVLHRHTNGNPFFLVTVVQELVRQGLLAQQGTGWILRGDLEAVTTCVPDSIRHLIEHQLVHVSAEEQDILAVASVAGVEFSAAAVAAGTEQDTEHVETHCDALARRGQFLVSRGSDEWPDGTVATHYRFSHDLYHEVLYDRVPMSRQVRWHRQIGARLEAGYGANACEIAVELAMHFQRGRDVSRAVHYLQYAGEQALRRSAHQEARVHLNAGLAQLQQLPDSPERAQQELQMHVTLGPALIATKGYADPDVAQTYSRARELCQQMGETPHLLPILYGSWVYHLVRAELQTARDLAEQCRVLSNRQPDSALFLEAHQVLGISLFYLGDLASARRHLEQGIALYDPVQHHSQAFLYGQDHGVACLSYTAWVLWFLGYPDQALRRSHEALSLAQELSHPYSRAFALNFAALIRLHRREGHAAHVQSEALIALSVDQGFALYNAHGMILRGGALIAQAQEKAGIVHMQQGLDALHATGAALRRPYYLAVLAEGYAQAQQVKEGLTLLTTALETIHTSAERLHEAELYRLRGQLTLQQCQGTGATSPGACQQFLTCSTQAEAEAEACFLKACAIARRQQAKSWELRAAISLSRLWQRQGKRHEARDLLASIYTWFTEGFDTVDLQEAQGLLTALEKGE